MKTNLDRTISSPKQAIEFLKELKANREHYDIDCSPFDVYWFTCTPTESELEKLEELNQAIWAHLPDPHSFLLDTSEAKEAINRMREELENGSYPNDGTELPEWFWNAIDTSPLKGYVHTGKESGTDLLDILESML